MELSGNKIHLYLTYPEKISNKGLLKQYDSLLTDEDRELMSRFYYARHRHQFLITRALLRSCLSNYFPVEPAEWQFDKNEYGKPEVSYPKNTGIVRFNISHCDGLIICAVTKAHDIGVDIEDARRSTQASFESLSSYFSELETTELKDLPANQQKQRFFDYWTLKESYIKARGMGLAIPLAKFSFRFNGGRLTSFETHPDLNDDAAHWQFWRISRDGRFRIAIAVNSVHQGLEINAFNTVPLQSYDPVQLEFL
jgi:4'-phosphopantetheinyl transferase